MITFQIPQSAQYLPLVASFTAPLVAGSGLYDFSAAPQGVAVLNMQPNTIYLVSRISISGDVPSEEFSAAINTPIQFSPTLIGSGNIPLPIYTQPLTIGTYSDSREAMLFLKSDIGGDVLSFNCTGLLQPTPYLIGRTTVTLGFTMEVYAVNETTYNAIFRDGVHIGPVVDERRERI